MMCGNSTIPSISVILPVFNCEKYVGTAIESILNQTYEDFELIIIDDGSEDSSDKIIKTYANSDQRIVHLKQKNKGLVVALNEGIKHSKGSFLARMDADDISLPDRFEQQIRYLQEHPDTSVLGGLISIIDKHGKFIRLGSYPFDRRELNKFIEDGSPLAHPTVMMRKKCLLEVGVYRAAFEHAEDYDLWLRFHSSGKVIENLPIPILKYRQHDTNVSTVYREKQSLSSTIARMAYQCRQNNLPDPSAGLTKIDYQTIQLFPEFLVSQFFEQNFEAFYGDISSKNISEIKDAFKCFQDLSCEVKSSKRLTRFLIRCCQGCLQEKHVLMAVKILIIAAKNNPKEIIKFISSRLLRIIKRNLAYRY